MFSEKITPRFSDTDALGHINNTVVPIWFEGARDPVFRLFMKDLDVKNWQLILAKIDVSFHAQMFYGKEIEIKTFISRIGNASFNVYQELWQNGSLCSSGTAAMVHYCYKLQSSQKISEEVKASLLLHKTEHKKSPKTQHQKTAK